MIPKKLHFIWIGENPLPTEFEGYIEKWKLLYSDYDICIWTNSNIEEFCIPDYIGELNLPSYIKSYYTDTKMPIAFRVDILRYFILEKYGGIYLDVDFEPIKKLPDVFLNLDFLGGIQNNGEIAIGFIGCEQNSQIIKDVINSINPSIYTAIRKNYYNGDCIYKITGPEFFNGIVSKYKFSNKTFFFTSEYFYPYWMTDTHRKSENFSITCPLAYAVHHWAHSWKGNDDR